MMFSKTCEYGIKAMIFMAERSVNGQSTKLKEVAAAIDSPEAFTAKILQTLSREEIIISQKGKGGGYSIPPHWLNNLFVGDVVRALGGSEIFVGCALGLKQCNDNRPCPMHTKYKEIRTRLTDMLNSTKIVDLALGLKETAAVLKL